MVSEFLSNLPRERKGRDARKRKRFAVEQVVVMLKLNLECPVQTESQDQDHGKEFNGGKNGSRGGIRAGTGTEFNFKKRAPA